MKESNNWKIFETTGSVIDYLQYRQKDSDGAQGKETDGQYEGWGNYSAGHDSSEYPSGRI